MKSKLLTVNQEPEKKTLDNTEGVDVSSGGPAVASLKKNKIVIIAASTVLTVLVFYFLFFKEDKKPERLEEVRPPVADRVAQSDSGKSPFEIDVKQKNDSDLILEKPKAPDVPSLPDLPKNEAASDKILPIPQDQASIPPASAPTLPQIQLPETALPNQQNVVQQDNVVQPQKNLDPRYAPIIVMSEGGTTDNAGKPVAMPSLGVGYENNIINIGSDPINKLEKTKPQVVPTYITDRSHTIAQGKLLSAVLETAINTEIPGFVRAIVSRDVYGESGTDVLIPRGSRLFGAYSSQIIKGQGRVEISWTRLIRSDGVDLNIAFKASDQFGRSGIPGDVDNRYGSIITNSLLTSMLAIGVTAAAQRALTNNSQTTTTTNPQQGTVTTTGNATNQAVYDVSRTVINTIGQMVGNALDMRPVIKVPQGTKITVIVNSDINIPPLRKSKTN